MARVREREREGVLTTGQFGPETGDVRESGDHLQVHHRQHRVEGRLLVVVGAAAPQQVVAAAPLGGRDHGLDAGRVDLALYTLTDGLALAQHLEPNKG